MVLWIPSDLCSVTSQQDYGSDPPRGMGPDLKPFPIAYEVHLHLLGRQIRGVVIIATTIVCWRGFTIARVHSYGKGGVGVELATTNWVTCKWRPFQPL